MAMQPGVGSILAMSSTDRFIMVSYYGMLSHPNATGMNLHPDPATNLRLKGINEMNMATFTKRLLDRAASELPRPPPEVDVTHTVGIHTDASFPGRIIYHRKVYIFGYSQDERDAREESSASLLESKIEQNVRDLAFLMVHGGEHPDAPQVIQTL